MRLATIARDMLIHNIRYSLRVFRLNPGFTLVAVASLALGIGANTAIFSLVDAVLLRWLPVKDPQELVVLARNPVKPAWGFNYPDYVYIHDHNQVFSDVVATQGSPRPTGLSVPDEGRSARTELVGNTMVTGNYFEMLGVTPALGRLFTPNDNKTPGAHPVAVLSYNFWRRRFGGDARVLGKRIVLNGSPFAVIGVARAGFQGTASGSVPDLYTPAMMLQQIDASARDWNTRHYWWLTVVARLKPGVGIPQAAAALNVIYDQIYQNDPERKPPPAYIKDWKIRNSAAVLPGSQGYSQLRRDLEKPLLVLAAVVGLVLLIACANVANLLLARAASRQKEIAIRLAVGASRGRLIGQLLTESLLLACMGGLVGLALAYWGVKILVNFMPHDVFPVALSLTPDLRLLGFAFGVSIVTGIVFGLIPALKATRPDVATSLKSGLRRFDLRKALVVAQVGLSLLLLIGAGLFVRTLANLRNLDPGFARERVVVVSVDPGEVGYKGQRQRQFFERLQEGVQNLPGVRSASLASITPLSGSRWNNDVGIQDYTWKPSERPDIDMNAVSEGYFATMGIALLQGREFRPGDNPATIPDPSDKKDAQADESPGPPRVAIINETMAKRFYPPSGALGRRFSLRGTKFKMENSYEVIGVVKDARYFGMRETPASMIYVPNWRAGGGWKSLCIRTSVDPNSILDGVRRQVQALDPAVPVKKARTMEQQYENDIVQERLFATLCSFFGLLALTLSSIGLYGVTAQAVTRRTREIGIRMALGAQRAGVLWLVLREVLIMVALGGLIGVPVALAVTRFVSSFLYGLKADDPAILVGSTVLLALVTMLAGYLPARRATRVDPMVALRYE